MKKIYKEVQDINKLDPATHAERLGKLFEEAGELATEVNKTNGRKKHKNTNEEIKNNIKEEAADVIQNVFSIIDGFGIEYQEIVDQIKKKNKKWKSKISK